MERSVHMRDFRIALVQQKSLVGFKNRNIENTVSWINKAKENGASVVCFPELNITGHAGCVDMIGQAEKVPGGKSIDLLCELAAKLNIYICAGIAEDDNGIHYNTQFIVGPEGFLGKQRKTHLSADEYFYFRAGTNLQIFDLPIARLGIIICYDNVFPEISRVFAIKGCELLLCPHAARIGSWPFDNLPNDTADRLKVVEDNKKEWQMVHKCRAFDNGVYVALCNMVGDSIPEQKNIYAYHAGGCMVINPEGNVVDESHSKDVNEEILVVPLYGEKVSEIRRQTCFNLQTRRVEVFKDLMSQTQ